MPSPGSPGIRELGKLRGGPRVPQCAEEASNFWRYLRPDEPDPSPAEVAAEQARRAELAQRRAAQWRHELVNGA